MIYYITRYNVIQYHISFISIIRHLLRAQNQNNGFKTFILPSPPVHYAAQDSHLFPFASRPET